MIGKIEPHSAARGQSIFEAAYRYLVPLLLLTFMASFFAGLGGAQARSAPESFADLVEKLLPTVVNISTTQLVDAESPSGELEELFRDFLERRGAEPPQQRRASSLGSGFIIDPEGYIVTNHHVISGAEEISVRLSDDRVFPAKLLGSDEETDLAVLKVESPDPLPATKWGDSETARIGDWIIAIGNPFGLGGTVTAGIISAEQRDINAGRYDDFLQTDAAINKGNSGGPMFDMDGKVIGVNTAIFSPSGLSVGIGFAIPSQLASNVVNQLRRFGEVRRGWLGVRIQTVNEELAEGLQLDRPRGALVASVTPDGPAEKAGIQQGDVVLEFNGRLVPEMRKLPRMVAETPIGETVDVIVWRKGKEVTVKVKLGELDLDEVAALPPTDVQPPDSELEVAPLGLLLGSITKELREEYQLEEELEGVLVTSVDPAGNAAAKGIAEGDVIVEVDQEAVSSPSDVASLIDNAKSDGRRVVTLLVSRQGEHRWVAVRIEKS
ncbi:MAG: DegQ family serine endoprotease [Kiloniellales bacterium]|nr:DegQ family serine endoprotease [Kiloniellales bacterium]